MWYVANFSSTKKNPLPSKLCVKDWKSKFKVKVMILCFSIDGQLNFCGFHFNPFFDSSSWKSIGSKIRCKDSEIGSFMSLIIRKLSSYFCHHKDFNEALFANYYKFAMKMNLITFICDVRQLKTVRWKIQGRNSESNCRASLKIKKL